MKKKASALLLAALTLIACLLPGCAFSKGGTQTCSIPKNGIVRKADLEKIAESGGLAIYKGSESGVDYEWTFIGQDIKKPADVNLNVSFKPADTPTMRQQAGSDKAFTFAPAQKGGFPGNPTLSIKVGKGWSYGAYNLYSYNASDRKATEQKRSVQVVDGNATLTPAGGGEYFFTKAVVDSAVSSAAASSPASSGPSSAVSSAAGGGGPGGSTASAASGGPSAGTQTGGAESASAPASNHQIDSSQTISATITIRCDTAVKNWTSLRANKQDHSVVPADGCILPVTTVNISKGGTVYDLLVKVCENNRIQMQHKGYSKYASEYIQGINNLYEFDCGNLSGWMYCVNGWYPNYGVSRYALKNGDAVQFNYTCDLGHDLPGGFSGMG